MKRKLLSIILCLAMALSLLPTAALAEGAGTTGTIKVNNDNTSYHTLEEAVNAATEAVNGVLTYTITGKVSTTTTDQWIGFIKGGFTGVTKVCFVGEGADAELCISNSQSILGVQGIDVEVSFENLLLSHPNGKWVDDLGHATNYFACVLRNTGAAENTVTYTNCTFPNGACNNLYGKTVYDNCKFTNVTSGKYNLWNYGGNTEVKDSTFTGTRGIKTYNEGTLAVAPTVAVENTTFTGLTEKAAIVASKPVNITVETVSVSGCAEGFLTRDISGNDELTITANGTNIGGTFNVTGNTSAEAAKDEFNISAGTFHPVSEGGTVNITDYLAPGATINESGTVEMNPVAKVGTTEYTTLEAAFAELNANNYTLELLVDNAWDAATPVYWKAGTKSGYVATLTDALKAAYMANKGDITIVCRPGADVGTMTHGHVADNLTIYGNNAYISDGECDLEVDTYPYSRTSGTQIKAENAQITDYLSKDITITAYEMDNLGVWGQRNTSNTVNIVLTDCDGTNANVNQRVYISGNIGVNNITLKGCDFDSSSVCAVYSNADGYIVVDGCTFDSVAEPININHKASDGVTIEVKDSKFNGCGSTADSDKQYAAPIRFVNSGSGTMSANVSDCTITDTKGANGDILLGDGRTGQKSNNLELTVSGTAANVQAQQQGYYNGENTDDTKKADRVLTAADRLHTTIADLLPVTEVDLDEFIKLVTSAGYSFDGTSVAGTGKKLTVKWSPVSGCFDNRGASGHICTVNNVAATGNTPKKVRGNDAQFYLMEGMTEALSIKNVSFEFEPKAFTVCDNSREAGTWSANKNDEKNVQNGQLYVMTSGNVTVENCEFDKVVLTMFNTTGTSTVKNCNFANVYNSYAIKDIRGENISVTGTTIENCGGGIMASQTANDTTVKSVDISDNVFKNVDVADTAAEGKVGTRAILQIASSGNYTDADFTLDGNTATNCGPILRQLNESFDNSNAITKVKGDLTGLLDENGKLTYTGDSLPKTTEENPNPEKPQPTIYTVKFSGSDVADMKVASGTEITLPTATKYGYTFKGWKLGTETKNANDKVTISSDTTFTAVWQSNSSSSGSSGSSTSAITTPSKTENGTVTVSPRYASKGDTVTVSVKPNSGYVLETLTVTDKNGNELTLKDKGNGKYTFTMPAGKVEVKATFMEDNSMLNFFYDVPNNAYFYEAVKWAVKNGITTGVGNNLFAPEQPCTRAQIVTFLWRAAGSPEPKGAASGMSDVVSGSYYEKAVAWAIENGITTGTTTSTFSPDATCTRAQAVTFLARALNAKAASAAEFSDVPTDSYFADAVAWAAANGVTEGVGGGLFAPDNDCTRGQIVTFLYRAYNK